MTLKVHVDAAKIAKGLLAMVDDMEESYAAALKFGMLPAPLMDMLEKGVRDKLKREYGEMFDRLNGEKAVREIVHEVSLEMYRQTEMVV